MRVEAVRQVLLLVSAKDYKRTKMTNRVRGFHVTKTPDYNEQNMSRCGGG